MFLVTVSTTVTICVQYNTSHSSQYIMRIDQKNIDGECSVREYAYRTDGILTTL